MEKSANGRALIFFTSTFPCGAGETFIENEFPFLLSSFEKIIIVTGNLTDEITRQVPDHVKVMRYPYEPGTKFKFYSVLCFLSPDFWRELAFIKSAPSVKFSIAVLKTMFEAFAKTIQTSLLLKKIVRDENLTNNSIFVYSYWMNNNAIGAAHFSMLNPRVKSFCRAHGWDVYFERHNPPYLPFRNFIFKNANACFCISANGQKYLNEITANRLSNKIKLARLGTFNVTTSKSSSSKNGFTIVSCSNIIPLKRINLLIEAIALLKEENIRWFHFGSGNLEEQISALAREKLSPKANVQFQFMGQTANADVLKFYKENSVDVLVNTSETEGLPVSMMEAMSYSIPVIATNVGGVAEIVEHEHNGLLLSPNPSPEELAVALQKFMYLSDEERNAYRQNAFNTWNEKYNAEKNYMAFVSEILSL
ncbi:MAG: glycosyltransferase [Chitinophagales bacterium]|nr:glycosyltransferase [Chitinophagales bacterium]